MGHLVGVFMLVIGSTLTLWGLRRTRNPTTPEDVEWALRHPSLASLIHGFGPDRRARPVGLQEALLCVGAGMLGLALGVPVTFLG
jgi:hypothetical protein